jgi:hypothetical protein
MAATKVSPNCCLKIHPHPTQGESIGMTAEVAHGSCTDLPPARKWCRQATEMSQKTLQIQ